VRRYPADITQLDGSDDEYQFRPTCGIAGCKSEHWIIDIGVRVNDSILFLAFTSFCPDSLLAAHRRDYCKIVTKQIDKEFGNIQGLQCFSTVFGISYNVQAVYESSGGRV
jgi:hypothetical protein